jgi:hypothetical protein
MSPGISEDDVKKMTQARAFHPSSGTMQPTSELEPLVMWWSAWDW